MPMWVVVDVEREGREVIGEYVRREEDFVVYLREEDGTLGYAPDDCVEVVRGRRDRPGVRAVEVEAR